MKHARAYRLGLLAVLAGSLLGMRASSADEKPEEKEKPAPEVMRFIDQGAKDRRLAGFRTPVGIRVEIVAENVAVGPTGLAFADDGTPYVIEDRMGPGETWRDESVKVTYQDGKTRTFPSRTKKTRDVIKALVASGPGGAWDGSRIVLEIDQAAGLLHHDGWLYVASRGSVRRWKASKPGGALDVSRLVAHGFSADGPHAVSGLAIGPDGWLYISSGAGDLFAEGSDGSRATVLRSGAVFRCRPDGAKLHTYSIGFQNPAGNPAFDTAGHLFLADGGVREKGSGAGYRLMAVSEGADFGWRLAAGARAEADKARSTLGGDRAGKMSPLVGSRSGSSAGALIYNDTCFPESMRGLLLQADPDGRAVRAFKLARAGATFTAVEAFDLFSAPKDLAFRPRQPVVGPDGAIYLADERRAAGEGGSKKGRIYRLSWTGTKEAPAIPLRRLDSWAKILELADADLIKSLSSEEASLREVARRELARRGAKNRAALLALLADEDRLLPAKVSAVGALQGMFNAEVQKALLTALADGEDELRRLATEALGLWAKRGDVDVGSGLLKAMSAEDRDVRRAVAVALGRLASPGTPDNLANALAFDQSKDRYYSDGVVRALEMLGKPGIDALLSLADSGVQKDTNRVANTFLGLRSRAGLDALPTLLRNPHLDGAQRANLVGSCLNYQFAEPVALETVVALVAGEARETNPVKKALLEVLASPGIASGPKTASFVAAQLSGKDPAVRLAAVRAAGALRLTNASIGLVKALGGDIEDEERLEVLRALRVIGGREKPVVEAVRRQMRQKSAEIQVETLRTLGTLDRATALVEATASLDSKDAAVLRQAVRIQALSVEGARRVGKRWLDGKLPEELRPDVLAAVARYAGEDGDCARLVAAIKKAGVKP